MKINPEKISKGIIENVGGKDNIATITHCVTRLRLTLKDQSLAKTENIKQIPGVLGVVIGSGQYQIVLANSLFPVYDYLMKNYDFEEIQPVDEFHQEDEIKEVKKRSIWGSIKYYFNVAIKFLSQALTPFITVLYGAGMLKVVLSVSAYFFPLISKSTTFILFSNMADTAFYFMPIFIAYGASKALKSNPAFSIAMAAFLLYPNFVKLMASSTKVTLLGLPVTHATYSSSLLPALFSAILLAYLEKFFYKVIPSVLKAVFAPLCTLAVAMPIVAIVLAPLGTIIGGYIVKLFTGLYSLTGGIAVGILGAVWPFIIMGGMNMLFVAPMMELLGKTGYDNFFRPAWIIHNIAQGGACLAVAIRTKNSDLRSEATAAAISAIISGVSEPAIYGIDLRLKKPFIAVLAGSIIGGTTAGLLGAKAFAMGYSSILAIPIFEKTMLAIIIAICVAFVTSFLVALVLGFDEQA